MARLKDITGQRFGRLVAIRLTGKRKNGSVIWECKCDCGNVVEVVLTSLMYGTTRSCGCLRQDLYAKNIEDITGQRFGRLVAIRLTEKRKNGSTVWECKCDCGNVVEVTSALLHSGNKKSCGCLHKTFKEITTGQRFGRLVTIRLLEKRKKGHTVWECKCDCGNVIEVLTGRLLNGNTRSCGCLQRDACSQLGKSTSRDIAGQRFGRLVAIRLTGKRKFGSVVWECKCDCGNVVEVASANLCDGNTKSCGCLQLESMIEKGKSIDLKKQFGLIENTSVSLIKSKKLRIDSTTGHRGVSFNKRVGKYHAYIAFKHKKYHLGFFNTIEEAIEVRKQAEEKLFKPFIGWYEENYNNNLTVDNEVPPIL
jgi:ribosomal protein L13